MLLWLMNIDFAGGGGAAPAAAVYHRRTGTKRRSAYSAWAISIILILVVA